MLHICMHTIHGIHMILCMPMCTLVHIVDVRATLQNFVMIEYIIQILQINLFGLEMVLTPFGPKNIWVPKFTSTLFDIGVGSHLT